MRAFQLERYDGPAGLRLADVAEPVVADGSVVLDVHAIGINFPDLLLTKGVYQFKPELPMVPGCEVAGVVSAAPDGSRWQVGDRVAGVLQRGGWAERVQAPEHVLAPLPAGADFEAGAALIVNACTVHFALVRRGGLRAGETLLVLGAGGGIGSAAVQIGKGLGARVIAGVADEGQRAVAEAAGADEVLVLAEGFAARVRELAGGRGVDVVLDPLGDWLFVEATRALAPEGRILVIGFAAGSVPELKVNRLLLNNISAVGVAWGHLLVEDPQIMGDTAAALGALFEAGALRPQIGARYAFEQIPDALARLDRGEIPGKAVAGIAR